MGNDKGGFDAGSEVFGTQDLVRLREMAGEQVRKGWDRIQRHASVVMVALVHLNVTQYTLGTSMNMTDYIPIGLRYLWRRTYEYRVTSNPSA